ncbi:ferredoxin Fer [Halohasta litorea]|uniref:Ferredoxin Fer n=1 Tax=Halohasta litorea TaxID=869891 RepID=A0ABD6DBT6_9EURY|nr:ferredoxin Fer [Halohasta litorea]
MASPYDILGIDSDADEDDIKQAYRDRVKETHPDLGGSEAEFKRVERAYQRLSEAESAEQLDGETVVSDQHVEPEPEDQPTQVDFLNYEVLDDHGWSLDDEDLFEKAAAAGLDPADYGSFEVEGDDTLLEAAEENGLAWPYACRGGACANCAVSLLDGELSQLVDHILSEDLLEQGIRLSCNGRPTTDEMQVVYNVKHRPDLDDLRLPPDRFEKAHARK